MLGGVLGMLGLGAVEEGVFRGGGVGGPWVGSFDRHVAKILAVSLEVFDVQN